MFVSVFEVFVVETLKWVDVHILVNGIIGKDVVMEISLVMDVTLGPAVFSKAFNVPVNEDITFGSLLVEMDKSSGTVSSLLGFSVIIMLVMRWLIKANGMATFVGERNSFVSTWPESGDTIAIDPQELIGKINVSNFISFSFWVLKPESLELVIDEADFWCFSAFLLLYPVISVPGASRAFAFLIRFNHEDVEYCVIMLSVEVNSL